MFCMEKKILQFHLLLPEKQADFVAFVTFCQRFSWRGKKGVRGITYSVQRDQNQIVKPQFQHFSVLH